MRRLVLSAVVLTVGLAVLSASPARADEGAELQRLTNRVEMLIDLVARLRAEVVALEQRVARLETRLSEEPEGRPTRATATSRVVVAQPDVAGEYAMDQEATIEVMVQEQRAWEGEAFDEKEARARFAADLEGVDMRVTLEADGTFTASLTGAGDADQDARGTWTRKGTEITLVTVRGEAEDEGDREVHRGVWQDGRLTLSDAEGSFHVVLVRDAAKRR